VPVVRRIERGHSLAKLHGFSDWIPRSEGQMTSIANPPTKSARLAGSGTGDPMVAPCAAK
jgi:hypothetical protein